MVVPFRDEPHRWISADFLAIYAGYITMLVLRSARLLAYQARARLFVANLLAMAALTLVNFGFVPIPVLTSTLTVLAASLLLGPTALVATLVVTTAVFAAVGSTLPVPQAVGYTVGYFALSGSAALVVEAALRTLKAHADRAERALERLKVEEAKRLRTQAELADTEQALFRAQKLEAVGRLAAGVGHDFNNALQVILSWTTLLQDDTSDPDILEGLHAIGRAAAQGRELTTRLLTFGRREARSPAAVVPATFIQELAVSIKRLLPEDIRLRLDIQATSPVWADPAQLDQVLLNLSLNARDAMPHGGTLVLGTRGLDRADLPAEVRLENGARNWVDIWVRDTGLGMDSATLARIFEPFFTTKGSQGTGLGLSTAYAIIRQSQGTIVVESKPHEGSTFHVYLPQTHHAVVVPDSAPHRTSSLRRSVILLAEDEPLVRTSLARFLRKHDYEVIEAEDVPSGLRRVEQARIDIDILCTDGVMPGGETKSLIEAYRARWPEGKVLVCSGYIQEDLLRRAISAGDFQYLQKPFDPAALVDRIGILAGRPPEVPAASASLGVAGA